MTLVDVDNIFGLFHDWCDTTLMSVKSKYSHKMIFISLHFDRIVSRLYEMWGHRS